MSFFATPSTVPSASLSTALRALALVAAASAGLAQAQDVPPAPATAAAVRASDTAPGTPSTPGAALGRTRAEVVAELACARATGDIDAQMLRSYGLEPLTPQRHAACATGSANATAKAAGTQAR